MKFKIVSPLIVRNFLLLIIAFTCSSQLLAETVLPRLITDGVVIQRGRESKIWGWDEPFELIHLWFRNSDYTTYTDGSGEWNIRLSDQSAGGPFEMRISGSSSVVVHDVYVGDVWICSGQSNMQISMQRASPLYESEINNSKNPEIRYFEVPGEYNFISPQRDYSGGKWESADPKSVLNFSAVAYFFALEIHNKYNIPIGLINASMGGSPAEAWISEQTIKSFPKYYRETRKFKDLSLIHNIQTSDRNRIEKWYDTLRKLDAGYSDLEVPWYSPKIKTDDWGSMNIPGYWFDSELGNVNGVVWFRKDFTVPLTALSKQAKLLLGRIVDADSVYVNGIFIGTTGYQYPPRRYQIPPNILKEGSNTITVRVINNRGSGGFVADKPYQIIFDDKTMDLTGPWKYKLGAKMDPLEPQTFIRWKPVGLFNSMIGPLLNCSFKGVIWYQGESNTDRPIEYRELFPSLIEDWRSHLGKGEFPFIFVQLPNFMEPDLVPSESTWAELRDAQLMTLKVPNTGMAVCIDIGEWNDIHPLNKKEVAYRLSLAAQKVAYGEENIVFSGPMYQSMKIDRKRIILSFSHTGSSLVATGGKSLKHFAIAGIDKKFIWANAKIMGDQVIVWHDSILNPVYVRYAWADNPEGANLYNREGLPASPFRTDH